jgi:hypothetical protein
MLHKKLLFGYKLEDTQYGLLFINTDHLKRGGE